MNAIALRLYPGQDLRRTLLKFCLDRQIDAACVVTCVGSLTHATIRLATRDRGERFDGPFEIVSLQATLSRHGGHFHISLSNEDGDLIGGHLLDGSEIHTTAEIVLGLLGGIAFKRRHDPRTGYKELSIEPKA